LLESKFFVTLLIAPEFST